MTIKDVELLAQLARAEARSSFWAYRQYINPGMLRGWWQRDVARELQRFYDDLGAGKRPRLILTSPPQHGKSVQVGDLMTWMAGKDPDLPIIFASFSDRLGIRANLRLQRAIESEKYRRLFPDTTLKNATVPGRALRTQAVVEFAGHQGSFRNTTVNGSVTGEGLGLGVIDDPLKGRAEANSKATREKTWDWLTDDFFPRFAEYAGLLLVMTRWHVDDPAGRLIEELGSSVRVLRYPALAEHDEAHRKKGEPLFPELKSLEFIEERRKIMTTSGFESLYQGTPLILGGGMFPVEKFATGVPRPALKEVVRAVRYWDKAGTEGGGAFTAGTLMLQLKSGEFVVPEVRRGQWSALKREQNIRQAAEMDAADWPNKMETWVEQEPGSGGKESAEGTIRNLAGFKVKADRVTGDKVTRAEPYAAQVEGGNVKLVAGEWVRPFLDEHELFPNGKYKDQVDSAAGAFAKLTTGASRYTLENIR